MDTTKTTHISLCSGYGGIDLGLRRAIPNLRTVAYAEIEAFACENLLARMEGGQLDAAPIWSDLKSFPWKEFSGLVDILSGGYPCQPFSSAGKRLGTEDPRHLWPYIADGIRVLRPRICFFENVEGHISLGLREVIGELEELGYQTTFGIFSASECGAPHQRKRVFILAVASSLGGAAGISGPFPRYEGQSGESDDSGGEVMADSECSRSSAGRIDSRRQEVSQSQHRNSWPSRPGEQQYGWEPPRVVADSQRIHRSASSEERQHDRQTGSAGEESHQRQTQPSLGGDTDGSTSGLDYAQLCISCDNRTDELRLLGNGVVPVTAERAFRTLIAELFPHEITTDPAPSR